MEYLNDDAQFQIEIKRINRIPLVLFNKLFTISDTPTGIVGYWQDETTGELYTDDIKIVQYSVIDTRELNTHIKRLFTDGEYAVFLKDKYNLGILQFPDGKREILGNRNEIIEYTKPTREYIHEIVKRHGGCTVYALTGNIHLIEIYTK